MSPAHTVCARSKPKYGSMIRSFPGVAGPREYRPPTSVDPLTDEHDRRDPAQYVDADLDDVGPDDGEHATVIGVDHREHADDEHGEWRHEPRRDDRPEDQRDRDRRGEHANRITEQPRGHERDRRQAAGGDAEAALEESVRRDELALVVPGQQRVGDHDAADEVAGGDLEKRQVGRVRQSRDADERERARFRGDDGEQDRPPWHGAVGDEVRSRRSLPAPEVEAEPGRSDHVDDDDGEVQHRERRAHKSGRRDRDVTRPATLDDAAGLDRCATDPDSCRTRCDHRVARPRTSCRSRTRLWSSGS